MIEVKGKSDIVAKIICDSVSEQGIRLITYELTYPRLIHSEIMTHGMIVRNAASSRAIPFNKMAEQLTARPVRFGQANPGMQDKGEDFDASVYVDSFESTGSGEDEVWSPVYAGPMTAEQAWNEAKQTALSYSKAFYEAGFHKQVYNRLTEPFQMMKTVLSGTELENFFWLRNHGAADPTLEELARCMHEARVQSVPQLLKAGEWHLPYVEMQRTSNGEACYIIDFPSDAGDPVLVSLEQAIKVSCARTAAVSFRNEDYGLDKCLEVYARLIGDDRKHASAMQHQATPMQDKRMHMAIQGCLNYPTYPETWEQGVSHADRNGQLWSAQFKGWIMWRKTIPGENYTGEE